MRKYLLHFVFWTVFYLMWNRLVYFYISNNVNRLYFSALDIGLIILAFYTVYFFLMPRYLQSKKIVHLISYSVIAVVLLALFSSWIMGVFLHHMLVPIHFNFSWNYTDLQYNRFFIALLGVLGGCFVKLAMDRLEANRKIQVMEKERAQAELIYLKAQINPHFLFNSLNNLYTQLEFSPADARKTLTSLADMLRYQLYECSGDVIPLSSEIAYLQNYFNLQSIRKDNCITELVIADIPEGLFIAPLLLLPFVENGFKYVTDWDDNTNFIKSTLSYKDGRLIFVCSNTADLHKNWHKENESGIGVENVKKRLDLIYDSHYCLATGFEQQIYHVKLSIELNNA